MRVLYSREAEMRILGRMLTDPRSLTFALDKLKETDFYFLEHQIIFQAIQTVFRECRVADIYLVCAELKSNEKLKSVGDISYLTELTEQGIEGPCATLQKQSKVRNYLDLVKQIKFLSLKILKTLGFRKIELIK